MTTFRAPRLAVIAVLVAAPIAAQQPTVTLAEAIAAARHAEPLLAQAAAASAAAAARVRSATGEYLPSLFFSTSGSNFYADGPSHVNPATGQLLSGGISSTSISTGFSANVNIFTGFRRGATVAAARAQASAADAGLVDAEQQLRLTVTNQFFDALAAQQLARVGEAAVRRAEEQQATTVVKFQAGSVTRSDTLRSLVALSAARVRLAQTRARLAGAEAGLARLIGEDGRVGAAPDSAWYQALPPLDTAAALTEALAHAPEVRIARANRVAAAASRRAARAGYWPTIGLSANTGWNGSEGNNYRLFNNREFSLYLNWNLFDGFGRETQVTAQRASVQAAVTAEAEAEHQLRATLLAQLALLDAARQNVASAETGAAAAAEDLRAQQERYRAGLATVIDVLTSQEALTQAEVDALTARFDYLRPRAQVEALVGRPL